MEQSKERMEEFFRQGTHLAGSITGILAVVPCDRDAIRCLLPCSSMSLAPTADVPTELRGDGHSVHPLKLLVCTQHNLRPVVRNDDASIEEVEIDKENFTALSYEEAATWIPYVRFGSSSRNHATVSILYLDKLLPILGGRLLGFNKHPAVFDGMDRSNTIIRCSATQLLDSSVIFDLTARTKGRRRRRDSEMEGFMKFVKPAFNFRVIGETLPGWFVCRDPEFHVGSDTRITPVNLDFTNPGDLCPALPGSCHIDPMENNSPLGAIYIENLHWLFPVSLFPDYCTADNPDCCDEAEC